MSSWRLEADFLDSIFSRVLSFLKYRRHIETFMGHAADAYIINKYINTDMFDMFSDLPKNAVVPIMDCLSNRSHYSLPQQIHHSSFKVTLQA